MSPEVKSIRQRAALLVVAVAASVVVAGCSSDDTESSDTESSDTEPSGAGSPSSSAVVVVESAISEGLDGSVCVDDGSETCYRFISAKKGKQVLDSTTLKHPRASASTGELTAPSIDATEVVDWGTEVSTELEQPLFAMLRRNVDQKVHREVVSVAGRSSVTVTLEPGEAVVVRSVYSFVDATVEVTDEATGTTTRVVTRLPSNIGLVIADPA